MINVTLCVSDADLGLVLALQSEDQGDQGKMKNLFAIIAVLCGIALSSCNSKNNDARTVGSNDAIYVKAIYSLPQTLDPVRMNDTASLLVSNLIYDGLLRFTASLDFEGALAESWSSTPDGKKYIFKIRKTAKFHDGTSVRADDVVASLSRAVSPASTVYKYYDCIAGAEAYHSRKASRVSGIKKITDDSVSIELKNPFPPFLSVLAGATAKILPAKYSDDAAFFQIPNGSGPFKIQSKVGKEITLVRFDSYYGEVAKTPVLVLRELSENDAVSQAAVGAIVDLSNFPLSGKEPIFMKGRDAVSPVAATWIIGLNTRLAPFNNPKIRRAFKASADSEGFRKTFYPDALPAKGYIPQGLPGHADGMPEPRSLGKVPSHAPIKIAFPELLANEKVMREYLQKSFRELGWQVEFVPMAWDKLMDGYDKKTLQGFVVSMNMDYPDSEFLIRNFESKNPDNFSGISDRELDRLINQTRNANNRETRNSLYEKTVEKLDQLAVTVNLFHPRAHNWISPCVKGFVPNILADYYIDYRRVEVDSACLRETRGRS